MLDAEFSPFFLLSIGLSVTSLFIVSGFLAGEDAGTEAVEGVCLETGEDVEGSTPAMLR